MVFSYVKDYCVYCVRVPPTGEHQIKDFESVCESVQGGLVESPDEGPVPVLKSALRQCLKDICNLVFWQVMHGFRGRFQSSPNCTEGEFMEFTWVIFRDIL
jgi:hypothetical protein